MREFVERLAEPKPAAYAGSWMAKVTVHTNFLMPACGRGVYRRAARVGPGEATRLRDDSPQG